MRVFVKFAIFSLFSTSVQASSLIEVGEHVRGPDAVIDFCQRNPEVCEEPSSFGGWATKAISVDRLQLVNLSVNSSVREVTDRNAYEVTDYWTVAKDFGDCEDIALKKRQILIEKGWGNIRMRLAIVKNTQRKLGKFLQPVSVKRASSSTYHAVLVVSLADGDYVLDNLDNRVRLWNESGYEFEIIQDEANFKKWRRVQSASVAMEENKEPSLM